MWQKKGEGRGGREFRLIEAKHFTWSELTLSWETYEADKSQGKSTSLGFSKCSIVNLFPMLNIVF